MKLSDEMKKQLRRLSLETIKNFAQEKGLVLKGKSKDELIEKLEKDLKDEDLASVEELILQYRFAGKGAVHFFKVNIEPAIKLDDPKTTAKVLQAKLAGNPFENRLKPAVTEKPQIIYAEYITDDLLFIETAHEGDTRTTFSDWEEIEITPTVIIRTFIHIKNKILQVHAPASSAKAVAVSVAEALQLSHPDPIQFTLDEINELKMKLNAISVGSDLKRNAGEIDMTKHRGKGTADLDNDPDYKAESSGKSLRKKILQFNFNGDTARIELTVGKGTVSFKTIAGERVVEYVLSKIRELKSLP
ncbi:hypothetical protein P9302_25815 [Brevibacillus agri]|uniref:hypothetical protein n=1 Tax=Brevibacillus TaxID=55080 RepID=UPI002E2242C5|nr:hypothetical protein [Brevibacillus agri]